MVLEWQSANGHDTITTDQLSEAEVRAKFDELVRGEHRLAYVGDTLDDCVQVKSYDEAVAKDAAKIRVAAQLCGG